MATMAPRIRATGLWRPAETKAPALLLGAPVDELAVAVALLEEEPELEEDGDGLAVMERVVELREEVGMPLTIDDVTEPRGAETDEATDEAEDFSEETAEDALADAEELTDETEDEAFDPEPPLMGNCPE
jgi:hypothetical protein